MLTDTNQQDSAAPRPAEVVREACLDAALRAYEDARIRGLCAEGAWECAVGAIRTLDVQQVTTDVHATDTAQGL